MVNFSPLKQIDLFVSLLNRGLVILLFLYMNYSSKRERYFRESCYKNSNQIKITTMMMITLREWFCCLGCWCQVPECMFNTDWRWLMSLKAWKKGNIWPNQICTLKGKYALCFFKLFGFPIMCRMRRSTTTWSGELPFFISQFIAGEFTLLVCC